MRKIQEAHPTADELERRLAALGAERAGLKAALDAQDQQERDLLEEDAADEAFQAIDLNRRRTHMRLQKLAEREAGVREELDKLQAAKRHADWLVFVDRYETSLAATREALERVYELHAATRDITAEAQRAGFSQFAGAMHLQWNSLPDVRSAVDWMRNSCTGLRRIAVPRPAEQLHNVRFVVHTIIDFGSLVTTAYQQGQEAGFTRELAWKLVAQGRAEWPDVTRIPPRPVEKKTQKRKAG